MLTFYAAAAAGLGLRGLQGPRPASRRALLALGALLTAGVAPLTLAGASPGVSRWFNRELFAGAGAGAPGLLASLTALRGFSSPVMQG